MTPLFLPMCFLTAQMLPAAGMDWTMKQEQSRLLATGETDIDGGIEKGMRMVSPISLFPFFFIFCMLNFQSSNYFCMDTAEEKCVYIPAYFQGPLLLS